MKALLLGSRFITSKISVIIPVETSYTAESGPALSCVCGTSKVGAAASWDCPHSAVRCVIGNLRYLGLLVPRAFFGTESYNWKELSLSDAAPEIISHASQNQQDSTAVATTNTDPQGWGMSFHTALHGYSCCSWFCLKNTWFPCILQLCPMKQYWW